MGRKKRVPSDDLVLGLSLTSYAISYIKNRIAKIPSNSNTDSKFQYLSNIFFY